MGQERKNADRDHHETFHCPLQRQDSGEFKESGFALIGGPGSPGFKSGQALIKGSGNA